MFKNREEAARLLAEKLAPYGGQNPPVLAIPRGAVPMARIIAVFLRGELDVVLVHKLGAPGEPELAIGSVDETGGLYLSPDISGLDISITYVLKEKNAQFAGAGPCTPLCGRPSTPRAALPSWWTTELPLEPR